MKRSLLIVSLLFFGMISFVLAKEEYRGPVYPGDMLQKVSVLKSEMNVNKINKVGGGEFPGGILFSEDFEPGGEWHRWISKDLTDPRPVPGDPEWLLDTWEALGDSSWRMADTSFGTNGGYDNHWYMVLDTRPFMLNDTNATFSFYHRFSLEGGAADPPYDGWDGNNVRISVDSGATWQVLPFTTYTVTNSWAFGHPSQGMNEGLGIASWNGDQLSWRKESISLKEYCNDTTAVMLRFAFASDLAYSTVYHSADDTGNPDMFGWQIDSIFVYSPSDTFFFNDGHDNGDLTPRNVVFIPPVGGDLWHVANFLQPLPAYLPEFTPSGTHAAVVQNSGDVFDTLATYNPYMENIYQTGPISLPDTTPIYLDFNHIPAFADGDAFPNVDYWRPEVRAVDSTNWEAVWIGDAGEQWVFDAGFDQWTSFSYFWGGITNMSPLDLSRYAGQDVYLRWWFASDEDEPVGNGLIVDDIIIYLPINPPAVPTGLSATANGSDTTITVKWDFEEGITYEVWRTTPGDQYLHLINEVQDSMYVDDEIDPFQEYDYTLRALVKYEGTSDFASPMVGAEVIPATITEVAYDDAEPDTTVEAARNKLVLVKFTPKYYPVDLKGLKIFLVRNGGTGTAAQFTVWDDDGEDGMPGTKLWYKNNSGLPTGAYAFIFDDSVAIDTGSFYIGYKRFGSSSNPGLACGGDTSGVIDGRTYLDTDSGYVQVLDRDAMIHAYLDTTRTVPPTGIKNGKPIVSDKFILGKNYPNPFNPETTIPFVVPAKAAGQRVTLTVYNILGQKIVTLFDGKAQGLKKVTWAGTNSAGKTVSSGIYIYQLKGKNVSLTNRMLLIK